MKEIPLTQGKVALVDDGDYEWLIQRKWRAHRDHKRDNYYAETWINGHQVGMHRLILGTPKGMETDHANGNGLDNRRENIRVCTHSQNQSNQRHRIGMKTSRFKGVAWNKDMQKWRAQIQVARKTLHLGLYADETDAARAYDKAALQHFGELAGLNFGGSNG